MSGYYQSNPNLPPQYYHVDSSVQANTNVFSVPPLIAPDGSYLHAVPESPIYHGMPGPFIAYSEPMIQTPFGAPYEDLSNPLDPSQATNGRVRRRSGPGDHVKHRRTRSGCFTCRQRRVKCDEAHPVCERCRKGNRECIYPEPHVNPRTSRQGSKSGKSAGNDGGSSAEEQDDDGEDHLETILDEEEDDDSKPESKDADHKDASDTPELTLDQSPSPGHDSSLATSQTAKHPPSARKASVRAAKLASTRRLPQDVRFYLNYFMEHLSHHHYSLKRDSNNFLKGIFLKHALVYEPLLYAVVGYAAYFHTLAQPEGRTSTFLQYYNESVTRLRISITKSKKHGLATFLTILQLAAIEEVLGDWVNLMGHQKAAHELLTRLFTPESITQSEFMIKILLWYIRYDLYVGFQSGGGDAVLGREWYVAAHEHYIRKKREHPEDLDIKYEERFAFTRLVAKDTHDLFFRRSKGLLSEEEFATQLPELSETIASLEHTIDPALLPPDHKAAPFTGQDDSNGIVDPFENGLLWVGDYFTSNYLFLDTWGMLFMYNVSLSMITRKPPDPEVVKRAHRTVQIFEAIRKYPDAPAGAIIEAQASFAIATIFLPKDAKHVRFIRETFARIETAGYIYAETLRNRMLEAYGAEPSDWWLPNDERCPRVIRSIKNFIRDRTTMPRDRVSEDLREMRGIFSTLTITASPPSDRMSSASPEGGLGYTAVGGHIDGTMIYAGSSPEYHDAHETAQVPAQVDGQERGEVQEVL